MKWAAEKGELRDLPAMAASEEGAGQVNIEIKLLLAEPSRISEALASGEADAAYMDARDALARIAKQNIKARILAITYRNAEGKPERLLLAGADWIKENPGGPDELLAAHRAGINYLVGNPPEAIGLAGKMAPGIEIDREKFPRNYRWESGMDIADLIDLLDELRLAGKISPKQADELALRMVRHESLIERW